MRVLYFSDIHLRLGPREPLRPELRRSLRWLNGMGENVVERLEDHLRLEAGRVTNIAEDWLNRHDSGYDLLVNGGDLAMPLSRHEDRMMATEKIWSDQLARYGEERLFTLTGNHELGHGYQADPVCYPDLLSLRKELFNKDINRLGYGFERFNGTTLVALDSELISMASITPLNGLIRNHLSRMSECVLNASQESGPIILLTHNTTLVRRWLNHCDLLPDIVQGHRQALLMGGHYHVPRVVTRQGLQIHWSGGGSYPEIWLRFLVRVPCSGFEHGGPGAIEMTLDPDHIEARHMPYGVPLKRLRLAA